LTRSERDRVTAALAACGLAGAILFPLTCLLAGLNEPHFSFVDNATSDLGALTAHHASPYNLALSISGVLTAALMFALFRFLPRARLAIAGAVFVGVFGVGQFIDGLAREDCAVSVNAACRAASDAGRLSTHHQVHDLESIITFSALLLAPLLLGLFFRSVPTLRFFAKWSIAAALIQAVCLVLFFVLYLGKHGGVGVFEILDLMAGIVWIAALSWIVLRRTSDLADNVIAADRHGVAVGVGHDE
jgi:hypothetical membrane protein